MKRFLVAAIIFCSLCPPGAAQDHAGLQPEPSLDLTQYLAELDRCSAAAKTLEQHPEQAADLRKTLPTAWEVRIRGEHYSVPTTWLRQTLNSLQVNHWLARDYSKEIKSRLATMRDEAEALEQPPALGPGISQTKLEEILRRREFREVQGPTWIDRMREQIAYWLDEMLQKLFGGLGRYPAVGNVLLWALVAGLTSLLIIMLLRHFLRGAREANVGLIDSSPASRSWKEWSRDALAAAAREDYREAIRLSYWAGIFRLEDLGVWQVDRARTHREYLRLLSSNDTHRKPLAAITQRFELVWYGGVPASAEDFESVITQLETIGCRLRLHPATASS